MTGGECDKSGTIGDVQGLSVGSDGNIFQYSEEAERGIYEPAAAQLIRHRLSGVTTRPEELALAPVNLFLSNRLHDRIDPL